MSAFTETFGGSPVSPADVAYSEFVTATNLVLYWPQFSAGQANVAARFMKISATAATLNVSMPDATLASPGYDAIIFNAGGNSFNVVDYSGGALATVAPGKAYYFMLENNTTQAGVWQIIQFGVGTGSADASALAGAGLLAIGPTLNLNTLTATVSGSYTITAAQRAVLQVWTGGAGTITLPLASSVGNGFFFPFANNGSGSVSIAATDNIDGAPTSVFTQSQSGFVVSSGSTWYTVGKGTQSSSGVTLLNLNVSGNTDVVETSTQAQNQIQQFTGTLTGNINVVMPATVQIYYIFNNTSGSFTLTVKTAAGTGVTVNQGSHTILYCDGTNIINAFTSSFGGGLSIAPGSAGAPNLNFIGSATTGIYSPAANQFAITAGGKEVSSFIANASAVNFIEFGATVTGTAPTITARGDVNSDLALAGNGTGSVAIAKARITGGAIDGAIIGATTPAAITGTTIVANAGFTGNLSGNVTGNLTGNVTGNVSGSSGSTTGNAATATALQTARNIGGVSFNGTADITVASATGGFVISGGDLSLGANNIALTGSIGATGARGTKGWFTDLQVTNAIAGSITGNAATVTTNANLTGDVTSVGNATTIKASVALTGNPTATTQLGSDNSTRIATTAQVQLAIPSFFSTQSLAANGYQALPGGLYIQWGSVVTTSQTGSTTFTVSFPNACYNIQLTTNYSADKFSSNVTAMTATGFSYWVGGNYVSGTRLYWFAVGS